MKTYGKETKLYNVKAYRFGKCYGYAIESVSLDAALKYIDDRQGINNWEYFTEESTETENK